MLVDISSSLSQRYGAVFRDDLSQLSIIILTSVIRPANISLLVSKFYTACSNRPYVVRSEGD